MPSIKKDSLYLYRHYDLVLNAFNNIPSLSKDEKMMKQVVLSQIAQVDFEIKTLQKQKTAVQNPRDLQMAKNLIFLSVLYQNEKIICWGASYHFYKPHKEFGIIPIAQKVILKEQIALEYQFSKNLVVPLFEDIRSLKYAVPIG